MTAFIEDLGNLVILTGRVILGLFTAPHLFKLSMEQMWRIGVGSFGVSAVTAMFVGMTFTVQIMKEFLRFGAGQLIGGVVGLAMWRELGPLLTGVVIAGRVGAAISAELGTMKVTEQVEALEAMSQDPVEYLVVPRVLAATVMVPILVGMADIIGFLSGYMVVAFSGKINPYTFFDSADSMLKTWDVTGGVIKAAFFGFLVGLISTYMGLKAKGGAKGVGEMTTHAVVVSLIAVFVVNYFLSIMLF